MKGTLGLDSTQIVHHHSAARLRVVTGLKPGNGSKARAYLPFQVTICQPMMFTHSTQPALSEVVDIAFALVGPAGPNCSPRAPHFGDPRST